MRPYTKVVVSLLAMHPLLSLGFIGNGSIYQIYGPEIYNHNDTNRILLQDGDYDYC